MTEGESRLYRAQPGPQRAFCSSRADIAIYGGAAGGGKSYALLLEAAKWTRVKGYRAVLFRRIGADLEGGGGLWDESQEMYRALGGTPVASPKLRWTFGGARARIDLDHLQHEPDKIRHQGKQYAMVGFDELTHFEESQFWYLFSRCRSKSGVRPYMRATCNPDPDSFVRKLIDWWIDEHTGLPIRERSGVLRWFVRDGNDMVWADSAPELKARYPKLSPKSLTFIPASLADNPALTEADPDYEGKLLSLPLVEREKLLGGNWNVRPAAGLLFKRSWFTVVDRLPPQLEVTRRVRAWDKAATAPSNGKDPDWTEGIRGALLSDRHIAIEHLESAQARPRDLDLLMRRTAENDGRDVEVAMWQDPGQAGVVDVEHSRDVLSGYRFHAERASSSKVTYAGPVSSDAEGGKILVVRGAWNERFFNQLEAFPSKGTHDDIVDAMSLMHMRLTAGFSVDTLFRSFSMMAGT